MNGTEIAAAFNTMNDKRHWSARAVSRERKGEVTDVVHFEARGGMISLAYHVADGRFAVVFNKFHGAWGDYTKAIARSLFVVLNTLKAGGLPFEAPPSLAGMVIEAVTTDDNTVYVRWPGDAIRGHPATFLATDEYRSHLAGMTDIDRERWLAGDWGPAMTAELESGVGTWRDPAEPRTLPDIL